ncbi:MAG: 3'-5' exonuclease [Gammaproteobacteria bacterium]|nr:3'-5' exonuclease [Gammaproteobacteria bacterium]
MQNICVFDIETIPDSVSICRLKGVDSTTLNESEQFELAKLHRRSEVGNEFVRHHLHKVVAISACVYINGKHKVASLADTDSDEKTIIERFFNLIDNYQPVLVSWNGNGFDLPVLHYRSLFHGISAPTYWDVGHFDSGNKWSNYLSRFQWQHIDLMDVVAGYQARTVAPLNDVAKLCGFPGKLDTDGSAVLELYQADNVKAIRDYCETDVLNTYLVYLRFELMRGLLMPAQYEERLAELKTYLQKQNKPHFNEFLEAWEQSHQAIGIR